MGRIADSSPAALTIARPPRLLFFYSLLPPSDLRLLHKFRPMMYSEPKIVAESEQKEDARLP